MADKEYSTPEVMHMFSTLLDAIKSGNLQGTVLGAPPDSSSYDALASNAQAQMSYFMSNFQNEVLKAQRVKRMAAVPAAVGLGHGGVGIMSKIMDLSPDIGNALLGHYGADQAIDSLLRNANGLAHATGRALGGVMDPAQMQRNMRWAATQGALSFNNNFNDDGTINTKFTYGLSLPQVARVGNYIMSNTSQYERWAEKEMQRTKAYRDMNPNASKDDLGKAGYLTEDEIQAFRHGTAMTAASVKSFNDHIKSFQKEMNGFISSVSKITGSFDTAIDFIQDMTNGQAFEAGEHADRTRQKAMRTAANLRTMAANAGMEPGEMYSTIQGIGSTYNNALGRDYNEQVHYDRSRTANISAMGAAAYANWLASHPGATEQDKQRFQNDLHTRTRSLAEGDSTGINVMLALAVKQGKIGKNTAIDWLRTGRLQRADEFLKKTYGSQYESLANNKILSNWISENGEYKDLIHELDTYAMVEGTNEESFTTNQESALDNSLALFTEATAAKGKTFKDRIATRQTIDKTYRNAILDTASLQKAGLNAEQISELQSSKLGNTALINKIRKMANLDERVFNEQLAKNMGEGLRREFGDTEDVKTYIAMNASANPEVSDAEAKAAFIAERRKELGRKGVGLKNEYAAATNRNDTKAANDVLERMRKRLGAVASGENTTDMIGDTNAIGYMIENLLEGAKGNGNGNDIETVSKAALGQYIAAIDGGLSQDQAWQEVASVMSRTAAENNVTLSDANRDLVADMQGQDPTKSRKFRQQAFDDYLSNSGVVGLIDDAIATTSKVAGTLGKDFDEESKRAEIQRKFRDGLKRRSSVEKGLRAQLKKNGQTVSDSELHQMATLQIARDAARDAISSELTDDRILDAIFTSENSSKKQNEAIVNANDKITQYISPEEYAKLSDEEKESYRRDVASRKTRGAWLNAAGRAVYNSNEAYWESIEDLEGDSTQELLSAADAQHAENMSGSIRTPSAADKEVAKLLLKTDEKVARLSEMFGGSRDLTKKNLSGLQKKMLTGDANFDGPITQEHVAALYKNLLTEHADKSDEEFNEIFDKTFGKTEIGAALDFGKDSGISVRQAMSAYVSAAAAGGDEKTRNNALADGYVTQSYASGDARLPKDAQDYLSNILLTLKDIASSSK